MRVVACYDTVPALTEALAAVAVRARLVAVASPEMPTAAQDVTGLIQALSDLSQLACEQAVALARYLPASR